MKRFMAVSVLSLLVGSTAAADPLPVVPNVRPVPVSPAPSFKPVVPLVLQCPDPSASAIDFSIVSRASRFQGRVRITGTVRNVGGAPYESGANQQIASLYELVPGGRPRLVASRAFQNLAPGADVSVSFVRDWYSASPAEGEFPPSYQVIIGYDPDIRIDGNTKNDDCNGSNNTRTRSGADINGMLR